MATPQTSESASMSSAPSYIVAPRPLSLPSLSNLDVEASSSKLSRRDSLERETDEASDRERSLGAARRAAHNAVERARRDKLNARILELASILPNLAGVRRPSRIAITKSSIAHIHLARRHRIMAAQELRALHAENAALRSELNEWRQRACVAPIAEPRRSEGFSLVMSGAEMDMDQVDAYDDDEFDERYSGGSASRAPYPSPHAMYPSSRPASRSPTFAYTTASPSSSPRSGYPAQHTAPPYPSPPSSSEFLPPYTAPTQAHHFDTQMVLKAEEDWSLYSSPAPPIAHFREPSW